MTDEQYKKLMNDIMRYKVELPTSYWIGMDKIKDEALTDEPTDENVIYVCFVTKTVLG